jgi:hypothetical protein
MKILSKKITLLILGFFLFSTLVYARDLTSTNFIIRDPIIGTFGNYGTSTNFELFTAGNMNLSGVGSSASFQTRYGFLYFTSATAATISFDLDTATTDTETGTPYAVPLGTLTTSAVARSNGSINSIWTNLDTNAVSGAVITVISTSLKSASVPTDTIPSATATMAAGTANYGLCVATTSATTGTHSAVAPYNGATCVDGAVNTVGIVDGTARTILNSGAAAIEGGRAQIRVNAAISGVTPAHNDYFDDLTFIATGTF